MSKMVLRGGKFYVDNKEVSPEIGNADQIRLLKELEQTIRELEEGTHEPIMDEEIIRKIDFQFKCVCGSNVFREFKLEEYQSITKEVKGETATCRSCNKKYEFNLDEYQDIVVKLTPTP